MYCPNCGKRISDESRFCSFCGEKTFRPRKKKKNFIIPVFISLLIIAGVFGFFAYREITKSRAPDYNKLSESVVKIECYDENEQEYATGSGVILFSNDIVVTNYHVIADDAYSFYVVADDGQKKQLVTVVAYDENKDIAILQLNGPTNVKPLPIGDSSNLQRGDKVIAIGSPLGLLNTVSEGIISGFLTDGEIKAIQTTAPISNGSSGGALINTKGELIGITYAGIDAGQNLNFAIPAYEIEQVMTSNTVNMNIVDFYNLREHLKVYSVNDIFRNYSSHHLEKAIVYGYLSYCTDSSFYLVDSPSKIVHVAPTFREVITYQNENDKTQLRVVPPDINEMTSFHTGDFVTVKGTCRVSTSKGHLLRIAMYDAHIESAE